MPYYRGEPIKETSTSFIIVIILCVVFGAIIIVLLFENSNVKTKLIEPGNCPKITGNYGVIPNVDESTLGPINSCSSLDKTGNGTLGNSICRFNCKSLISAETICDNFPGVCKGFSYSPPTSAGGNGTMTFYNTSFTPTSEPLVTTKTVVDVYTKQV